MATKKSAPNRKSTAKKTAAGKRSNKGRGKVEKVMHEFKHHELRSRGRKKVTNPKQAIAIALSEAREAGADVPPPRKRSSKKAAGKSAGGRKSTAKKSTARKSSGKSAPRKSAAKKSGGKKTARKSGARR